MLEALLIIFALGTLETTFWLLDRAELRKQTELLEEISVTLALKEHKDE